MTNLQVTGFEELFIVTRTKEPRNCNYLPETEMHKAVSSCDFTKCILIFPTEKDTKLVASLKKTGTDFLDVVNRKCKRTYKFRSNIKFYPKVAVIQSKMNLWSHDNASLGRNGRRVVTGRAQEGCPLGGKIIFLLLTQWWLHFKYAHSNYK